MKPRFGVATVFALFLGAAGPLSGGCKTATQVTVEIKTVGVLSCSDLKGVDVVVAGASIEAEQRTDLGALTASVPRGGCDGERTIGTLVVTPGSARAAIVVVARVDEGAKCTSKDNYKGCIVARRSFAFVEHAALTLPISLEASCKDVPCTAITSCRTGACVSSEAECIESTGLCESNAEPQPLPDGGFVLPDGATPDAPFDGPIADGPLQDAPIDADGDVADGGGANPGNECPAVGGGTKDCRVPGNNGPQCCAQGAGFFCGASCPLFYASFACTGRKYCGAQYCCGTDPDAGSDVSSACGDACAFTLCNTNDDCPPDRQCSVNYYPAGGVGPPFLKQCGKLPPPP